MKNTPTPINVLTMKSIEVKKSPVNRENGKKFKFNNGNEKQLCKTQLNLKVTINLEIKKNFDNIRFNEKLYRKANNNAI